MDITQSDLNRQMCNNLSLSISVQDVTSLSITLRHLWTSLIPGGTMSP